MRLYYRYDNITRAILTREEIRNKYHGIIIPGTFATYYKNSVGTFLENYEKSFFIDPMTYFLNQPASNILNRDGNPRKSYKQLSQEYLDLNEDIFNDLTETEETLIELSEIDDDDFCQRVLNFQLNSFQDTDFDDFDAEYLADEEFRRGAPELLVTPYFLIENDNSYELNRRYIELTFDIYEGEIPLYACIVIGKQYLRDNPNLIHRIVEDFSDIENFIIWVSEFDAVKENLNNLEKIKDFVNRLSNNREIQIINLYGDYFSFLLSKFGLTGFCSGLSGGTKKRAKLYRGGGGGIATKVYTKNFYSFLLEDNFRTEILMDDRLICNCTKCQEIIEPLPREDPRFANAYLTELMDEKNYLLHFLYCRGEENIYIEANDLEQLKRDLEESFRRYRRSIYATHLENWINDV